MSYLEKYLSSVPFEDTKKSIQDTANKILKKDLLAGFKKKFFNELLLGEVQSGKTSHMFGVMAAAIDAGFYHFLLVTSDNTKLQNQTFTRALESFQEGVSVCGENDTLRFKKNMTLPSLVILKKNSKILKKWRNEFLDSQRLKDSPIFIIDDEADAGSLNTKVNKDEYSAINMNLRAIRDDANSCIYMQVTATPQAVMLQSLESDFRPDAVTYFEPGEAYVGGNFFFAKPDSFCIREIDESEIDDNKEENAEITEGLATAVRHFLLVASETSLLGKDTCSALVHPSVRIKEHNLIALKIRAHLNDILLNIDDDIQQKAFEDVWRDIRSSKPDFPSFNKIYSSVRDLLFDMRVNVITLNSESDASQTITKGFNIVIGGNTLGRGVTFPHLQTVYYSRTARVPQADTFWQHCRMFGYDRDRSSIRLYMPPFVHKLFQELNSSQNALVRQIRNNGLDDTHLLYMNGIRPTRKNVIDAQKLQLLVGGVNYFASYPQNKDLMLLDQIMSGFPDSEKMYQVDISLLKQILNLIDSACQEDWQSKNFVNALDSLAKMDEFENKKALLLVKRNRAISSGTGTMLSANDRLIIQKHLDKIVFVMYRLTGARNLGWNGTPLWMPAITLPDGYTFFKM
ncbi:MAG: hypothetical protein MJY78_06230 [Fibrobacter sp.]|nr:hypothetical protein [Fibrobacter sp.]